MIAQSKSKTCTEPFDFAQDKLRRSIEKPVLSDAEGSKIGTRADKVIK